MARYKLSNDAKNDLARIYWRGASEFGEAQAELYFEKLMQALNKIAEFPFHYPAVNHIREGYRRGVCGNESIYFRITNEDVEIMRLLQSQNLEDNL
jgi:toxin ParE1/3/4